MKTVDLIADQFNVSSEQRAYLVGKLYRETKKERTDTLIQNAPIANCLPTGSTAERIAEQFNVSGRETKVTDTFKGNQYTGGGNNFPQQKTADRIAEQFNVSGRAEARLHIVCLPADPARDHVLIPRENAGRRIDDMSQRPYQI